MRSTIGLKLIAALALSGCTAESAEPAEPVDVPDKTPAAPPAPLLGPGSVTSILNAGVMVELGDESLGAKFLFDPLYDDHFDTFEPLDDALIEAIVTGAAPYDGIDAVFVSHAHGDHFSASMLNRLLAAQPDVRLYAPAQAIERLHDDPNWSDDFLLRVTAIALENGEHERALTVAGVTVEAFRSPHNGWPDDHSNVHNLSYRLSAPVRAGDESSPYHRVIHLGDADPSAEHFRAHGELLGAVRNGLVIVPFWFLRSDDPDLLIGATLNAEHAIGMHVPAQTPNWVNWSDWQFFTEKGEQVSVPETR
jgi:L-ascorbate metabolism protein UlaG (beta-lactamase superfamily)